MNYLLILVAFSFISSSAEDTCNEKLGDTFHEITVDSVYIDSSLNLSIKLDINSSKYLPIAYLKDFKLIKATANPYGVNWNNPWEQIDTIHIDKKVIRLVIKPESLPKQDKRTSLSLHLNFADRLKYIECIHPGSWDNYSLDMDFDLKKEKNTFTLYNFTWKETLNK